MSRAARTPGRRQPSDDPVLAQLLVALGRRLREGRKRAGLTEVQLGAAAGISRAYVFYLETYGANLTFEVLWRLSQALRVGPRDLLPESDWGSPTAGLRSELRRIATAVEATGHLHADVRALVARFEAADSLAEVADRD